jgi:hypothetical protein
VAMNASGPSISLAHVAVPSGSKPSEPGLTSGLAGRLTAPNLLGAIGLAIVLPLLARAFWRIGIRPYSGASA